MKSLASITAALVGLEYELGRLDCFALIIEYLKIRGLQVPDSFKGWTMETYKDLYLEDPPQAKQLMVEFMGTLLVEIPPPKAFAGDVLLLEYKGEHPFLAIDGGNGVIITAFVERGVSPSTKRIYETVKAFRLGGV